MKFTIKIMLIAFSLLNISCTTESKESKYLKKAFKERLDENIISNTSYKIDTINNVYSNYEYHIAFNAPKNWIIDQGVSKRTIFRGHNPKLALTFSINVVEPKGNFIKYFNAWDFYINNKVKVDISTKKSLKKQLNIKVEKYKVTKGRIRNFISAKYTYEYKIKSTEFNFTNYVVMHRIFRDNKIFTFSIIVPKIIYDKKPQYFEHIFDRISFLANLEEVKI